MGWVDSQKNYIFDDVGDGDDNTMLFSENILVPSVLCQMFFSSELFMLPFTTKHPTWVLSQQSLDDKSTREGFAKILFLNMTRGA